VNDAIVHYKTQSRSPSVQSLNPTVTLNVGIFNSENTSDQRTPLQRKSQRHLPDVSTAIFGSTEAASHQFPSLRIIAFVLVLVNDGMVMSMIIESELRQSGYILKCEECQLVEMLLCQVFDNSKDSDIRGTGVVDESSRTREELAVDLIRVTTKFGVRTLLVRKFVECEQVHILALSNIGSGSTTIGFLRSDNLSDVTANESTFLDIIE
jgi:hypothetical protein